jgi:putative FmdB family regulatory protein
MPIYAYKCDACGFAKDVLQKIADPVLTDCPSCGKAAFSKQLAAPGFHLKGSGWYATDFKGSGTAAAPAAPAPESSTPASDVPAPAKTAAAAAAPAAAASPGCGGGCACHA